MSASQQGRDDRWQVSPRAPDGSRRRVGPHLGPVRITPLRGALAIALVGSGIFNLAALLLVHEAAQIAMLSAGLLVMGLTFAALAVGGGIATWRAGADGRSGEALALAIAGGLAGLAAAGCFAGAVVLALIWGV